MKIKDIPYNMEFIFGPNLREVPVSKIDMLQGMIYINEQLKSNPFSEEEKGKWNGLLGTYLRMVGELEESEKHLQDAIQIYENLNHERGVFINKLRLAHTYQWWTNFEKSNQMFADLQELAETDSDYTNLLDYVYQHCGKNIFDQKDFQAAKDYFERALELRKGKENEELIASTETAVEACEYRLENFKA